MHDQRDGRNPASEGAPGFATRDTHSGLSGYLTVVRDLMQTLDRETDGFFLRAESFYTLMTQVEAYENTEAYRITREFLRSPQRMLGLLFDEQEP